MYFHSRGWLYLNDASGLYKPYSSKMMGLYSRIPPNPVSLLVFPFQTDVNFWYPGSLPGDKPTVGNHRNLYPNYPCIATSLLELDISKLPPGDKQT